MANNFTAAKVVGTLPGTLTANTLYLVRSGVGFALYCSDATGTVAHPINAPTAMVSALNSLSGDLSLSLSQELAASALDPIKKAGTATLTNGRRTVTFTATQSVATGDFGFTTGKHYFGVKFVSGSTSGNAAVGVVDTSITNFAHQIGYDLPQEVGMFQNSGNIYSDESLATTGDSFAVAGDEVMVAVDCDSRLVWFRVNGGDWNNNPASSPETGVGGVSLSGTGNIMPAVCTDEASVWDFKPSGLTYPAPTGYGSWSAPAGSLTVTPSDVRIESPTTGQVLMFNGTEWYNGDLPSGGGGGQDFSPLQVDVLLATLDPITMNDPVPNSVGRTYNGEETYLGLMVTAGATYGNVYTLNPEDGSWTLTTELADNTVTAFVAISSASPDYGPEDRQVLGIKRAGATRSLAFRVPGAPLIRTGSGVNGFSRLWDAVGDLSALPTASKQVAGAIAELAGSSGGGDSHIVGEIKMWPGATAPAKFLLLDGSAVSRTTHAALFTLLGTAYGAGNGSTTFNLPDMRDRVALGASTTHVLGTAGGASSVTLADGNLPLVPMDAAAVGNTTMTAGKNYLTITTGGPTSANIFRGTAPASNASYLMGKATPDPVSLLQPHLALNYIIYSGA